MVDGNAFKTAEFEASPIPGQVKAEAAYAQGAFGEGVTVGVVDENNEIRFNNCGSSKDRCLVAPGIDIETTENGGGTETVSGSSFPTPARASPPSSISVTASRTKTRSA